MFRTHHYMRHSPDYAFILYCTGEIIRRAALAARPASGLPLRRFVTRTYITRARYLGTGDGIKGTIKGTEVFSLAAKI